MDSTVFFTAIITSTFLTVVLPMIVLPIILSGERSKAAQETARRRRLIDAKMNARLLRFNL